MNRVFNLPAVRGHAPLAIALRKWGEVEWVTHLLNLDIHAETNGKQGYSHGHYFDSENKAIADYLERISNYLQCYAPEQLGLYDQELLYFLQNEVIPVTPLCPEKSLSHRLEISSLSNSATASR